MNRYDALCQKFDVVSEATVTHPELHRQFTAEAIVLSDFLARFGKRARVLRAAHGDLGIKVRKLLPEPVREAVRGKFREIDAQLAAKPEGVIRKKTLSLNLAADRSVLTA